MSRVGGVTGRWSDGPVAAAVAVVPGRVGAVVEAPELEGGDDEKGQRNGGPLRLEPADEPATHRRTSPHPACHQLLKPCMPKKRFLRFFYFGHVFYVFNVFFYFPNVFLLLKKRWQSSERQAD